MDFSSVQYNRRTGTREAFGQQAVSFSSVGSPGRIRESDLRVSENAIAGQHGSTCGMTRISRVMTRPDP